jgi:hypothetical protein
MRREKTLILSGAVCVILTMAYAVRGELLGDYVGYSGCAGCHDEQVAGWKTTPHAEAFEVLKTQGEEKQENPNCVKCHVVGYDKDGGFIDMELTPELKDVQCESCHGPGRKHSESLSPDDVVVKPGETVCRACHTESQDKSFDYETKSKLVHGKK